jgi:hypothetical protein
MSSKFFELSRRHRLYSMFGGVRTRTGLAEALDHGLSGVSNRERKAPLVCPFSSPFMESCPHVEPDSHALMV